MSSAPINFTRIARWYDLMNRIISLGQDMRWRRSLARRLDGSRRLRVLDVAAGTGDQMRALTRHGSGMWIVGVDVSGTMLSHARRKFAADGVARNTSLLAGDSHRLPFADGVFDAVTVSFGIRNFHDPRRALMEMHRVLAPGGQLLILELTVPRNRLIRPLYHLYSRVIIPRIGQVLTGDLAAYRYLHRSIDAFPPPPVFSGMLADTGFRHIRVTPMTCGAVTVFESNT